MRFWESRLHIRLRRLATVLSKGKKWESREALLLLLLLLLGLLSSPPSSKTYGLTRDRLTGAAFLRSLIGRLDNCVGSILPFRLHQLLQQDMVSVCLARLCQKNVKQNLKNSVISDSSVPPDASWVGWQMSGEEVRKQIKGVGLQHLSWHRSVGVTNPSANKKSDRTKSPPKSIFSWTFLYSFVDRLWERDDFDDEHESWSHFCSFNLSPDRHWKRHSWSVSLLSVMDGKDMADVTLRHSLKFLTTLTLMTTTGACVWAAIAITCHQIYQYLRYPSFFTSTSVSLTLDQYLCLTKYLVFPCILNQPLLHSSPPHQRNHAIRVATASSITGTT